MERKLEALKFMLKEISHLEAVSSLLYWDQCTYMPTGGAEARAGHMATLARLIQQRWLDPHLGELLEELRTLEESLPYDSTEASLIRVARRDRQRACRVPPEFMELLNRHSSECYQVWATAKPAGDFAMVKPYLEKTVELSLRLAEFFPNWEHPADPLIDMADPGETVAGLSPLFRTLEEHLRELIRTLADASSEEDSPLKGAFPEQAQLAFGLGVLKRLGYDLGRGRQDLSPHPFTVRFHNGDVRITTRVDPGDFTEALFSSIHEAGHALYEQGIPEELEDTPLGQGASAGLHESQSRLWENLVARSDHFWKFFYPRLQETFPGPLGEVEMEDFLRAVRRVRPGPVRTEADEVTYNLHVIIRFQLELALLEGTLKVAELPDAWTGLYEEKLGVTPPDHRRGVLQDMHWFSGIVGGAFQCYTLGNLMSAQIFQAALREHPEIPGRMEEGDFSLLLGWLRRNIHCWGRKLTADEIMRKATGEPLKVEPYLDHLRSTYTSRTPRASAPSVGGSPGLSP